MSSCSFVLREESGSGSGDEQLGPRPPVPLGTSSGLRMAALMRRSSKHTALTPRAALCCLCRQAADRLKNAYEGETP